VYAKPDAKAGLIVPSFHESAHQECVLESCVCVALVLYKLREYERLGKKIMVALLFKHNLVIIMTSSLEWYLDETLVFSERDQDDVS
jgi:hypothetical protein